MQYSLPIALYAFTFHIFHLGRNGLHTKSRFGNLGHKRNLPSETELIAKHNTSSAEANSISWAQSMLISWFALQELEVDLTLTIWWTDHRLILSPNISSQSLWPAIDKNEAVQIWMPTVRFRNCKGCSPISSHNSEDLYINKETNIIESQTRLVHKFSCGINLRVYPMDIQFCQIQLYTYEDTDDGIQLQHLYPDKAVNLESNLTLAEYHITPIIKKRCVYENSEGGIYSCLELGIRLEHLVTYHLMTAYAPTSFIVILSWISFWLPLDLSPARVALGLTSLLTLATRLDQTQRNLPPVAYAKAIDIWMFACIFLVSSSLCEFAISYYRQEARKTTAKVESQLIKVRPAAEKESKLVGNVVAFKPPPSSDQFGNCHGTSLDCISRILFPLAFFLFNIVYWSYYLTYYN